MYCNEFLNGCLRSFVIAVFESSFHSSVRWKFTPPKRGGDGCLSEARRIIGISGVTSQQLRPARCVMREG